MVSGTLLSESSVDVVLEGGKKIVSGIRMMSVVPHSV
jgi:hypothetical protein